MALQVWIPLNGDLTNQGTNGVTFSQWTSGVTVPDNNGKIGKCYINSSHSAGGLISDSPISIGPSQSMFCWFKFTDLESSSSLGGGLVNMHRYPKNTGMGITIKYVSATTGYLSVNTGTGSGRTYNTYCGTTLLQANTWYHGGFTYDGTNVLKIYVNGICEKTVNIGQMSCPEDYMTVFCWSTSNSSGRSIHADYKFSGSINDVRVYDHALSPKEVEILARGLVAHYPMTGGGRGGDNIAKNTGNPVSETSTYNIQNYNTSKEITSGTVYTATIKGTIGADKYFGAWMGGGYTGLGSFTSKGNGIFTLTFTGPSSVAGNQSRTAINIYAVPNNNTNKSSITWFKLEKGGEPTPWMPNPADAAYTFMGYNNNIEYDVSGYNNHATITGTVERNSNTARYSTCTGFNSSTYESVSITPGDLASRFTFAWWARYTLYSAHMFWGFANGNRLNLFMNNTFCWNTGDGANNTFGVSASTYADNNWHHFAVTGDGTTVKLYIDGEFKANAKTFKGVTGTSLILNGWDSSSSYDFNGYLSDFRIYATALSATQVAELYNTSASISNNGTLLAYEFIEN